MQPTPVFLPGKSQGQKSLVGYSPQGHKESNRPYTQTHTHRHTHTHTHTHTHPSLYQAQKDYSKSLETLIIEESESEVTQSCVTLRSHGLQFTRLLCPWDFPGKSTGVGEGFPGGLEGKASTYSVGGLGLIPESGRSPGEGNGNPLQYSCLENPMDGGAHGVAKSQT